MASRSFDLACRMGGPQGSGIDTLALILMHACSAAGYEVLGRREYHSNIMGRHSYCDVRLGARLPTSHRDSLDLLVAVEPETLCRHIGSVRPGGLLIHCADDTDVPLERPKYLSPRLCEELHAELAANAMAPVIGSVTHQAQQRGVRAVPIPVSELLRTVQGKVAGAREERLANMIGLAAGCALLGLPARYLLTSVRRVLGDRPEIAALNRRAVDISYRHVETHRAADATSALTPRPRAGTRLIVNGSQATALGKLAGGLAFQSYYPITPATDESTFLETQAAAAYPDSGVGHPITLQVEDELAALAMACGAALTGARSSTATSGPGFSLMSETLGWAGMTEIPVVVTLYQRGGPSTGMPSRNEQGDLLFALHGGHGEFPRMVLASGDLEDCFEDAARALNYAERFQIPVIHLLDKALTATTSSLQPFDTGQVRIERGKMSQGPPVRRFALTTDGISPRPLLGAPEQTHWLTGCEHGPDGRVSEDPSNRDAMMAKRARKLEQAARCLAIEEKLEVHGDPAAHFTVLAWGSTKGAALEAVERMCEDGTPARLIQVRLLWPFPSAELDLLLDGADPLVVAECNYSGQLARLVDGRTSRKCDHLVAKFNGRPFSGEALRGAFADIAAGRGKPRMEIHHDWE